MYSSAQYFMIEPGVESCAAAVVFNLNIIIYLIDHEVNNNWFAIEYELDVVWLFILNALLSGCRLPSFPIIQLTTLESIRDSTQSPVIVNVYMEMDKWSKQCE